MPTPRQGYQLSNGIKVPGVTTVLGRFKESGALMYWAWEQGKEGLDFRRTKQDAADAGTLAHAMVEAHLTGIDPLLKLDGATPEIADKAKQGLANYLTFEKQTNLKVVSFEKPLISEKYHYGGTPDAIVEIDGHKAIADWKTSSAIYVDALLQMAAYGTLYAENYPEDMLTGGFHLCRFSKDNADFVHYHFQDLSDAWEMFKHLLAAYELDKVLKKMVK